MYGVRAASSSTSGGAHGMEVNGIKVEKVDKCVLIRMERVENRLNMEFFHAMNKAMDKAERSRLLHMYIVNS